MIGLVAELQILWADVENCKKEGCGFYKMDENNIQLLWEDLTDKFHAHALAQMHTTGIGTLRKEFTDEQLQLAIDLDKYEREWL